MASIGSIDEFVERYDRQIRLIGIEGQKKLAEASVAVIGAGGLGSAASIYLVAAGVGEIYIIDNGLVELSNLQRQILYTLGDIGRPKVMAAKERLEGLNPNTRVVPIHRVFDEELADEVLPKVDVVIDALDNWESRVVLDKAAWRHGKPYVHAGVHGFYGQLTVLMPGKTPCLRCIFPPRVKQESPIPVFATTPGVLGVLEANEALKLLLGKGSPLMNKILIYDGLIGLFEIVNVNIRPDCPVCGR